MRRGLTKASIALSVSGVAGPDGGSDAKPVGTVWICMAVGDTVSARSFNFIGDREAVRDRAAKMALTIAALSTCSVSRCRFDVVAIRSKKRNRPQRQSLRPTRLNSTSNSQTPATMPSSASPDNPFRSSSRRRSASPGRPWKTSTVGMELILYRSAISTGRHRYRLCQL